MSKTEINYDELDIPERMAARKNRVCRLRFPYILRRK